VIICLRSRSVIDHCYVPIYSTTSLKEVLFPEFAFVHTDRTSFFNADRFFPPSTDLDFLQQVRDQIPVTKQRRHDIYNVIEQQLCQ
jgi:hypothetical protein